MGWKQESLRSEWHSCLRPPPPPRPPRPLADSRRQPLPDHAAPAPLQLAVTRAFPGVSGLVAEMLTPANLGASLRWALAATAAAPVRALASPQLAAFVARATDLAADRGADIQCSLDVLAIVSHLPFGFRPSPAAAHYQAAWDAAHAATEAQAVARAGARRYAHGRALRYYYDLCGQGQGATHPDWRADTSVLGPEQCVGYWEAAARLTLPSVADRAPPVLHGLAPCMTDHLLKLTPVQALRALEAWTRLERRLSAPGAFAFSPCAGDVTGACAVLVHAAPSLATPELRRAIDAAAGYEHIAMWPRCRDLLFVLARELVHRCAAQPTAEHASLLARAERAVAKAYGRYVAADLAEAMPAWRKEEAAAAAAAAAAEAAQREAAATAAALQVRTAAGGRRAAVGRWALAHSRSQAALALVQVAAGVALLGTLLAAPAAAM